MFPWNYGFHWSAASYIFLGAFYTVLAVVATTVISAVLRSRRALLAHATEEIRWHSDFHDLPVLTGELTSRECPHAFDCRHCETHAQLIAAHPPQQPGETEEEIFGMSFPMDCLYHRGHAWARPEADGTVTVGLDELGSRLVGAPDAVDLPQPGAVVRREWRKAWPGRRAQLPGRDPRPGCWRGYLSPS